MLSKECHYQYAFACPDNAERRGLCRIGPGLAQNALKEKCENDEARLNWLVQQALTRPLAVSEARLLSAALAKQRGYFSQNPGRAEELLKVGESPRDLSIPAVEHAAWAQVCLLVLNLDETLSKP